MDETPIAPRGALPASGSSIPKAHFLRHGGHRADLRRWHPVGSARGVGAWPKWTWTRVMHDAVARQDCRSHTLEPLDRKEVTLLKYATPYLLDVEEVAGTVGCITGGG